MDKKLKAKWVKALRSGKFEQGQKALRIGNTYCCLGVLCEVAEFKSTHSGIMLNEHGHAFLDADTQERLAMFNDNGRSFQWIASYIQRYIR